MILSGGSDDAHVVSAAQKQKQTSSSRYIVIDHLGDGTFGRALKCVELDLFSSNQNEHQRPDKQHQQNTYAVKVVRAVPRYTESAKFEAQILKDL